jgi:predicted amidohydrolase
VKKRWRIAVAQLVIVDGNKELNLQTMEQAIDQAFAQNADILVFPELILTGLISKAQMQSLAEPRNGKSLQKLQRKLQTHPVHVLYSFPEYVSEDEFYITTCFLRQNGDPIAFYRKTHLFTEEADVYNRGKELVSFDLDGLRIGLLTCYDIEFPEPARALALQGAQLLIVNSANMTPYEWVHRTFIRARAMENQIFVVYCNRLGSNEKYDYHGQSAVVGPDGDLLLEIPDDVAMVKTIEIDLDRIGQSKATYHYLLDRRPELYL